MFASTVRLLPPPGWEPGRTHSEERLETFWTPRQGGQKTSGKPLRLPRTQQHFMACLITFSQIHRSSTRETELASLLESLHVTQLPRELRGAEEWQSKAQGTHALGNAPMAPGDDATRTMRLECSGAAKWGLREEVKKFEPLFSRGTKPRNPTSASDQHQRRFSWPVL